MSRTYRFYINLLLILSPALLFSQVVADSVITVTDPADLKFDQRYGLRIGADLHKISKGFYTDDYRGIELVGDFRLTKRIYAAAELGNEDYTLKDDVVDFTTKGSYLKVGFDYNVYDNWLNMENMIYVGVRYGISSFSQTLNSYTIYDNRILYNPTPDNTTNPNLISYLEPTVVNANREYSGLSAHWGELVGGVKAEILNNLYLGFSVRLNLLIAEKKPDNFENLYIPGFNRTYSGSFGAGFNYTISYFIPLYKKTPPTVKSEN